VAPEDLNQKAADRGLLLFVSCVDTNVHRKMEENWILLMKTKK